MKIRDAQKHENDIHGYMKKGAVQNIIAVEKYENAIHGNMKIMAVEKHWNDIHGNMKTMAVENVGMKYMEIGRK
ncbi:hypothetical protein CHS0354_035107 [Potamilus streckersoni]|uniref:Uncharacterized protein n=1 Tax=Potamilus streckersoni TaxID=2493646 RepID=A0AAE0RUL1_9BIVA|nr:hypothetical protein CHS0354_035107 [Potamilus streckersoni]